MQRRTPPSHLIDDFILLEKASLAASRTLLEQLIACLNFPINAESSKVVAFMSYGSNTSSWKLWRWMRLDIFTWRDTYIQVSRSRYIYVCIHMCICVYILIYIHIYKFPNQDILLNKRPEFISKCRHKIKIMMNLKYSEFWVYHEFKVTSG